MSEQLHPDDDPARAVALNRGWTLERLLLAAGTATGFALAGGLFAIAVQLAAIRENLADLPGDDTLRGVTEELAETRKAIEALKPPVAPPVTYGRSMTENLFRRETEDPVADAIREQTRQLQAQEQREASRRLLER